MFKLKIINTPENIKINYKIIVEITKLNEEITEKIQKWIVNIIFEDDEIIKRLNLQYRNIDSNTDVLSFHYYDDFSLLKNNEIAWEVLLSYSKILTQSQEYWNSINEEVYKLIIHSLLHIIWYDHENDNDYTEMKKIEDVITLIINKKFWIDIK